MGTLIFQMIEELYAATTSPALEFMIDQQTLHEIAKEGIYAQIYFLSKKNNLLEQIPLFFQQALKTNYEKGLFQNLFIKSEMEQIFATFEKKQIETIPLKGTFFAEKHFGDLGARPTSDIDLLVHLNDLEKTITAVKTMGFTTEEKQIPGHFHRSFSKELPGSPIPLTVELHWDILIEKTASFQIADFWDEAIPIAGFQHIKQLSNYHDFYMICLHGWRHNMNSLKYFIDMIQLIHSLQDELDYERLLRDASTHSTRRRVVRTLSIVYQQFPHLAKVKNFPIEKRNWWAYPSQKGLRKYIDYIDYQFLSYDTIKHSFRELRHWFAEVRLLKK